MSRVYRFTRQQQLKTSLDTAWKYFSDPSNLQAITPTELKFKILSPGEHDMYTGQVIQYHVRPLLNIPLYWMTEITHVSDKKYFIDEQRFGPYSFWHHQHHFEENRDGVLMKDIVHYKLPFWFIGDAANSIFVEDKLRKIFDHRMKVIDDLFNN